MYDISGGDTMTKKSYIQKLNHSLIKISHLTPRQLDYSYLEYCLFEILSKYSDEYNFKVLYLPENIEIKFNPGKDDYDIDKRNRVTLNAELYRLYSCGYFDNEREFIDYVIYVIKTYEAGSVTINKIVSKIRRVRIDFERERLGPTG